MGQTLLALFLANQGNYTKPINQRTMLSPLKEPQLFACTHSTDLMHKATILLKLFIFYPGVIQYFMVVDNKDG